MDPFWDPRRCVAIDLWPGYGCLAHSNGRGKVWFVLFNSYVVTHLTFHLRRRQFVRLDHFPRLPWQYRVCFLVAWFRSDSGIFRRPYTSRTAFKRGYLICLFAFHGTVLWPVSFKVEIASGSFFQSTAQNDACWKRIVRCRYRPLSTVPFFQLNVWG